MPTTTSPSFQTYLSKSYGLLLIVTLLILLAGSSQFTIHYKPHRGPDVKPMTAFTLKANPGATVFNCKINPTQVPCYPFSETLFDLFHGLRGYLWISVPLLLALPSTKARQTIIQRFAVYAGLGMFRVFILYIGLNKLSNLFLGTFDFSDHVVYVMYWLVVVVTEWTYQYSLDLETSLAQIVRKIAGLYTLVFVNVNLYRLYWTALYFHTPQELWAGLFVALLGVFGPTWKLASSTLPFLAASERVHDE